MITESKDSSQKKKKRKNNSEKKDTRGRGEQTIRIFLMIMNRW